ncbi:MAG: alpha/beta hydrolase, partial [Candidatus Eremiobacteraeota bacterium]|nr:alpha/beta hydrolase [Candidatus Eremiobacteraeota bacterium]
VALIGHSWGGAVVLLAGLEPFVSRVVAIDPMVRVMPGTWRAEYLEDAEHDLALAWPQREAEIRERLRAWHRDDVAGKLHAVRSMQAASIERLGDDNGVEQGRWDLRPSLRSYPKPLLVLAAAPAESTLSADDVVFLRTQSGPHVRLEFFNDQGHNLHRTAFDRYIERTAAFLTPAEK